MTVETAGRAALDGVMGTARRLRDQWLLIVFLSGVALWVRDTYQEFAKLPPLVRAQMSGQTELQATVARLEDEVMRRLITDRSPVLGFPGTRHRVADGVPGGWTTVTWRPVRRLRVDCFPRAMRAWMVDSRDQWFSAETALQAMPALAEDAELAFAVKVPEAAAVGRARLLAQVDTDCATHHQVETAPWLQFRIAAE